MNILWIFFFFFFWGGGGGGGGHHNIGLYLGVFLCILGSFRQVKVQNGVIFWGSLKFKYIFGCLKFLIFFFWGGGGER